MKIKTIATNDSIDFHSWKNRVDLERCFVRFCFAHGVGIKVLHRKDILSNASS